MTATIQLTIDLGDLTYPEPSLSTAERFAQFHAGNPAVFAALVHLVEADRDAGFTYVSIRYHWETLRRSGLRTNGRPWKLDNRYAPYFSRLICDERPDLSSLLRLRERAA